MENNYDWNNLAFRSRCGESLNLAVNMLTDVIHSLYVQFQQNNTSGIETEMIPELHSLTLLTILSFVSLGVVFGKKFKVFKNLFHNCM